MSGRVISDIEIQLAEVLVVRRVTLVGRVQLLSSELDVICGSAPCRLCGLGESQTGLAVLSIEFIVLESGVRRVAGVPAETSSVILTVQGQAFFDLISTISTRGVPTVVSHRALIRLKALLVRGTQLSACVSPRPRLGLLAELLLAAVVMLVAVLALLQALANALLTFEALALPGICALSAIVQLHVVGVHVAAVRLGLFVVELTVGHVAALLVVLASPVLVRFVDPGPLVAEQIKFTAHSACQVSVAP